MVTKPTPCWIAGTTSILLLFLLAVPSCTRELGISGLRSQQEDEWSLSTGVKDTDGDRTNTEAGLGFGNTQAPSHGAAEPEDGDVWGDPDLTTGLRPMLSLGEDGLWEPRRNSRCVPIPPGMALCQNIGYDTMRMPNLLGHESPAEAVQQSSSWLPLLARECHPDARIFLCSLFAPICLDRFISPCRSLCESVRDSCEPIMRCYGYPWPEILRCDQYPADHLMCISSVTNSTIPVSVRKVPQASCEDCELEQASSPKDTLEMFCRSDFVVKLRLTRLKYSPVSLSQFSLAAKLQVLKHGPLLGGQIRSRIELWLERDATCVRNMTRNHPKGGTFLITGTVQGERVLVNKAYAWHRRDKNLITASRKWKRHRCKS
ncbi:secreted frizzled-related protein 5 [Synchiropus splendidus]|uniref:secreted frizzled-related protein 5 n=1 Tax=Synchiropus splendidus TaxID=270530 RepID=UPI00237E99E4|nr:secreted frizzled-related protein 5 [Synchiropus splendidus]